MLACGGHEGADCLTPARGEVTSGVGGWGRGVYLGGGTVKSLHCLLLEVGKKRSSLSSQPPRAIIFTILNSLTITSDIKKMWVLTLHQLRH